MIDPGLCKKVEAAAKRAGVTLRRGTIVCAAGPTYETPAEVRWLQELGADLATMSAAPEVDCAARLGLRSAVIAAVTNPATGISHSVPGHDEVVEQAGRVAAVLGRIIKQLIVK
jgi:purine-nucleoside phosphorylase